jgi:hypothetical protein
MSIQIITGFSLNSSTPIDTRIVASGSSARNAIAYKYEGLRVFDLSDNTPYVYVNGSWITEGGGGGGASGTVGTIGRFTSSDTIGDSNIYQTGTGQTSKIGFVVGDPRATFQIGGTPSSGYSQPFVIHKEGGVPGSILIGSTVLGHNWYYSGSDSYFSTSVGSSRLIFGSTGDMYFQNKASGPGSFVQSVYVSPSGKVGIGPGFSSTSQPAHALVVNGTITGTFSGNGSGITGINPNNISNQILINAGTSLTASNSIITNTSANANHYLTFVPSGAWTATTGKAIGIRASVSGPSYNPYTKQLTLPSSNDIIMSNVNSYTLTGNRTTTYTFPSTITTNLTISTVIVPGDSIVTVEATFTAILKNSTDRVYRSNKFISSYSVSSTGVFTQIGSTTTIFNVSSGSVGSIYPGDINTSTNYQVKFKHSSSSVATATFYSNVEYKVTVVTVPVVVGGGGGGSTS